MLQKNHIPEKNNLDQTQYTLVLSSVSNNIHINTLHFLHIIDVYKKHKNALKIKRT